MGSRWLKCQAAGCVLLTAVLVGEWFYGQAADDELQAALAVKLKQDYPPNELPEMVFSDKNLEDYRDMVERPLFIEGRKPVPEPVAAEAAAAPTVDSGQVDEWLLIGVYSQGQQLMALFSKRNEAKTYLKIQPGQSVADWQLKTILPDQVVLEKAGQQKNVPLRKPKPKIAVQNQTPRPPLNRNAPPPSPPGRPAPPARPVPPAPPIVPPPPQPTEPEIREEPE